MENVGLPSVNHRKRLGDFIDLTVQKASDDGIQLNIHSLPDVCMHLTISPATRGNDGDGSKQRDRFGSYDEAMRSEHLGDGLRNGGRARKAFSGEAFKFSDTTVNSKHSRLFNLHGLKNFCSRDLILVQNLDCRINHSYSVRATPMKSLVKYIDQGYRLFARCLRLFVSSV